MKVYTTIYGKKSVVNIEKTVTMNDSNIYYIVLGKNYNPYFTLPERGSGESRINMDRIIANGDMDEEMEKWLRTDFPEKFL